MRKPGTHVATGCEVPKLTLETGPLFSREAAPRGVCFFWINAASWTYTSGMVITSSLQTVKDLDNREGRRPGDRAERPAPRRLSHG
jgi:hypothetical protein